MGKKELYIQVPSLFRCPISLDVMKSPVSLSTGVTYDRTSIQRWLDSGNNTCPATMQLLPSKDFVPNHTLHRLIQIWSHNHTKQQQHQLHSLSSDQVLDLISRLSDPAPGPGQDTRVECFVKILCYASDSPENRKFLASNHAFVTDLVDLLASDGPDLNPDLLEAVLKIFQLITSVIDDKEKLKKLIFTNPNLIPNLAKILKTSGSDSRVAVARIIETTAFDHESKKIFFEDCDILNNLLEILNFHCRDAVPNATEITAVLSCLIALTSPRRNKIRLIEAGGVPIITKLISLIDDNHLIIENLLTLLEMLVGCTAARAAVTDDPNCIAGIIEKIMKVSTTANEHAAALLWSLCYLFRDQKAREAMSKSNGGLTKILLLMQSDCSPAVKKMCCDLLRVFRINSKSCLSNYDTKTTHIMPC
ncbi:U-box domain-containing protein 27-like [Silene latifolia]|uniref:U-box domain-containing protein 27-like n=1 Tax=Silene latifolia TaxID=37657 RepID=UPI003D78A863